MQQTTEFVDSPQRECSLAPETTSPGPAPRILIVDDNRAIHDDYRKVLEAQTSPDPETEDLENTLFGVEAEQMPAPARRFTLDSAYQGSEALERVREARAAARPYAMAFMDVRMPPGWDGVETAARVWEEEADLQIVLCSAFSDYSWSETVGRLGCRDDLLILRKPFDSSEVLQLAHALTRKWELGQRARDRMQELESQVAERTRELQSANDRLKDLADRDPLTGLLNRRGLARCLALEAKRHRQGEHPLGALLIDCDRFKQINDCSGYKAGDAILIEIAERIKGVMRSTDHASRIGGDEFLVLLPDLETWDSQRLAERIRSSIAADPVPIPSGQVSVTVSAGVCEASGCSKLDEIVCKAETALHESKARGRNRTSVNGRSAARSRADRRRLVERFLEPGRLQVVRRPLVRLEDDTVCGHELLVAYGIEGIRDLHDLVDAFGLPGHETDDSLSTVDLACLDACLAAGRASAAGDLQLIGLFGSTVLAGSPEVLLERLGIARGAAPWVEVRRDQGGGDLSRLAERTGRLQAAGITLVLGEMGLQRASLEALILLSPSVVKLQAQLVNGCGANESKRRSLRRLTRVVRATGTGALVAAGIASASDVATLRAIGIEYGEGPLWSDEDPDPNATDR